MSLRFDSAELLQIPKASWIFSGSLHVGCIFLWILISLGENFHWFDLKQKDETFDNVMQVDLLAMPEMLFKDQASLDIRDPVNPRQKRPTPTDSLSTTIPKLEGKDSHLSQESAIKQLEEDVKREQAIQKLQRKLRKTRPNIAGNLPSQGTMPLGAVGDAKEKYLAELTDLIRSHFNIYPWQKKEGLRTVIHLILDARGKIDKEAVMERSRDPLYDAAVLKAIRESEPFPLPEDARLLKGGFDIKFIP